MKFRIKVLKDPDAKGRGFSLLGLRLPLRTWVPVTWTPDILNLTGKAVAPVNPEFWKLRIDDIIRANPAAHPYLRDIDYLLVPTDWCDLAPVESWETM